ncbi:tetratricopeptide repeat protein [Myxococcus sp. AB025B]|uniref:tetratricopeptide repeat protein n=1 Tax=Myxococcus sp. AB025B TaxID=2562794 RepID=UPI0011429F5D|nr:tetratricopeptide repeat protein [Myxococcus sp. AB025B]
MHRLLAVLCLVLVAGCASAPRSNPEPKAAAAPEPSKRPPFLNPAEIIKRLEDSPVTYRIDGKDSPPGGWADQLWPQRVQVLEAPRVVEQGGERVIVEWPESPEARALLDEAEPHFQAKRYAEAGKLYEKATSVCPQCYFAWNFRGDAAYFAGDSATALGHYQQATRLNPDDHRSWFFLGNALARLGRFEEALESWAWCLVLNPRYPVIRQFFRANAGLGLVVREDVIVPRGYAERDGEEISIQFDPDHDPAWFAFANCKALWLGEPSHRQEMTGTTKEHFTSLEEMECLGSALLVHENQKKKGETERSDPTLERLSRITEEGLLMQAVLFEVGARVHPQVVLTLDDDMRQRLKTYVLKHVLVPASSVGKYDL